MGIRVREFRVDRGWGVDALARRAGISRTTLHNIETGRTPTPRAATLKKLAEVFQISVAHLFSGSAPEQAASRSRGFDEDARRTFDRHTNPMVDEVRAGRPRLFTGWSGENWDELYSEFGVGGALTFEGVVQAAETINRKRETLQQLSIVLDTDLGEVAAQLIATLHTMVEVPPKLGSTPRAQSSE